MAAYRHLGNSIYVGLSTDTKPTAANTANGAICIEWATNYATFTLYVNNQTAWLPQTAFAETWTNKTLTSPIISTISNTGTLTLPTSTDTLMGKATTDIQTNKTLEAGLNTFKNIPVHPGLKKTGSWMASAAPNSSATSCSGILNMTWTIINVGTNTFTGVNKNAISGINGGLAYKWSNGGAGASQAGFRSNPSPATYVERDYNPRIDFKLKLGQTTAERVGMGFLGSTSAPLAGVEPAGSLAAVMFWLDTSVDANWHILQNLNSATSDKTTIANVAAADTNAHVFSIRAVNASTKWQYYYGAATDGPPNAGSTWVDINTTIPAATSGLNIYFWTENIGATTPFFDWYWMYSEQDV